VRWRLFFNCIPGNFGFVNLKPSGTMKSAGIRKLEDGAVVFESSDADSDGEAFLYHISLF
jgi:hypothetical protein